MGGAAAAAPTTPWLVWLNWLWLWLLKSSKNVFFAFVFARVIKLTNKVTPRFAALLCRQYVSLVGALGTAEALPRSKLLDKATSYTKGFSDALPAVQLRRHHHRLPTF